jgi:hypothetical protein
MEDGWREEVSRVGRDNSHCSSPRRASTRSGSGWLGLFCFGAGVSPNKGPVDLNRSFGQRLFVNQVMRAGSKQKDGGGSE